MGFAPVKEDAIEAGDILWVIGSDEKLDVLTRELGWQLREEPELFADDNSIDESGIVEGVVIPHSNLAGHTMEEMKFRELKLRRNPDWPVGEEHPTVRGLIDYEQFCGLPSHSEAAG